jgi:uncharacterized protein (UPF0335 family)
MTKMGHNSKPKAGGVAVDQLKSIIGRVEKLEEEKAGIGADIRDVFAEAKGNGFDVPAIRKILKLRKMDAQEREETEHMLDVYLVALDMKQPDLFDGENAA